MSGIKFLSMYCFSFNSLGIFKGKKYLRAIEKESDQLVPRIRGLQSISTIRSSGLHISWHLPALPPFVFATVLQAWVRLQTWHGTIAREKNHYLHPITLLTRGENVFFSHKYGQSKFKYNFILIILTLSRACCLTTYLGHGGAFLHPPPLNQHWKGTLGQYTCL